MTRHLAKKLLPLFTLSLAAQSWGQTMGPKAAGVGRAELSPITGGLSSSPSPRLTLSPSLAAPSLSGSVSALPTPQVKVSANSAPSALPPSALPAPALPDDSGQARPAGETVLETVRGQPNRLGLRIDEARALWAATRESPVDVAEESFTPQVARLAADIEDQLTAMNALSGHERSPLLAVVTDTARYLLRKIDAHVRSGEIDPTAAIRTSASDPSPPVSPRPLRVGVYPVAADPFHWAHLLVGLEAMANLKLDKVVFVLAGDDPRKPAMTPAAQRHPMGQSVLEGFSPFFAYSSIAVGTTLDGETNMFRLLALNADQEMRAFYLVGDDHYRLKDKKGNDDTIPKIEKNMAKPELGFDPKKHQVSLAFIQREFPSDEVPTQLEVQFLPGMEFEASSTAVRNGQLELMPYAAYDYVRRHQLGLYGIPKD